MLLDSNKHTGNSGLGIIIAYFMGCGYTVSLPINDTQEYDLVVEIGGKLKKVSVKTTNYKTRYGIYQLHLRNMGGTKGQVYSRVVDQNIDILAGVTGSGDIYIIPKSEIKNANTINLGEQYDKFKRCCSPLK